MKMLIHHVRRICTALVGAAAVMITMATAVGPVAASPAQTKVHVLDGHLVTLDVYPAAGPLRRAAILSHGFTRSRRTLAGHALADAGVLVLTPDLPCTFDFRFNARALATMVGSLRATDVRFAGQM